MPKKLSQMQGAFDLTLDGSVVLTFVVRPKKQCFKKIGT